MRQAVLLQLARRKEGQQVQRGVVDEHKEGPHSQVPAGAVRQQRRAGVLPRS